MTVVFAMVLCLCVVYTVADPARCIACSPAGFIVDEDEDSRERRRRKKKKRKHRERERPLTCQTNTLDSNTDSTFHCHASTGDFEALSDDDLDLVEQNTGVRIERPEGVGLHIERCTTASGHLEAGP